MDRAPRILFAGGGTGGHVYPAIAIADAVRARVPEAAIAFAGTRERMEWQAVPKAGYPIHAITVRGFHRDNLARNLGFPVKLARGLGQSWRLIGAFDPDVVVGTGGFVAGPVLLAGSLRGRPILLQEQNAYAGVTNRLLARRAAQIHIAFEEACNAFPKGKCVLSGNPTRPELVEARDDRAGARAFYEVPDGARMLFVFGGSLGARALNTALAAQHRALLADENLYLLWQTGARYFDRLQEEIEPHPRLRLLKYIDRMDLAYAAADLVLCRAGAITCSELMVTGTPAVLVPAPQLAEDHQTKNARSMEAAAAAVVIPEAELEARLLPDVTDLLEDAERRSQMAQAALQHARPDAAGGIARAVLDLATRHRHAS